jgi:transcriptional regulator GlxA family with amidase domain
MARQTVAIMIHDGVQALDVAGPLDVFSEANQYVSSSDRYETTLVAKDRAPLRASSGMLLGADLAFDEARADFDIVLVAGGPALPEAEADPEAVRWMKAAAERSGVHGSICTGAFVLGHAGLLDGRRVTTHWQNAQALTSKFPMAKVDPDAIYIRDGRLITSAGVTAGIDLALALVRQHHGPEVMINVAKRLVVVAQRQGGQSQFSPYLTAPDDPTSPVARVQAHLIGHIGERHTLESLAAAVGMSARNLSRHFIQEAGVTPHEFVERARVDAARAMLESSDRPLKAIAYECGFGKVDRMRDIFTGRLGVTPAQFRASFQRHSTMAAAAPD